jgi:nucleoside-diphosphate-sugar epimerase
MNVLVTGSGGFVGSKIVGALQERGHNVVGYDAKHGQDLFDEKSLTEALTGMDVVIHLAAYPHRESADEWGKFKHLNVDGTKAVLKAMKAAGVPRLLYCSTGNVYCFCDGINDAKPPILPKDTPKPEECHWYPRSKLMAEAYLKKYRGDIKVTIFRPNHFSPTPENIYQMWHCTTITMDRLVRTFCNAVEREDQNDFYIYDLIEPHKNYPTSLEADKLYGG